MKLVEIDFFFLPSKKKAAIRDSWAHVSAQRQMQSLKKAHSALGYEFGRQSWSGRLSYSVGWKRFRVASNETVSAWFLLCKTGLFICLGKYIEESWFYYLFIFPSRIETSCWILVDQKGENTKDGFQNKMCRYYAHTSTCASSVISCCK